VTATSLQDMLLRDEGEVLHAYPDHLGFLTIGVGRLIDKRKGGGITHDEAMYLLDNDIARVANAVDKALPWAEAIGEPRRAALMAMAFQMGLAGLLLFKSTLRLMQAGDWASAARQMLASKWAKQTPARAHRTAKQVETGEWQ
jgi:lysozyme